MDFQAKALRFFSSKIIYIAIIILAIVITVVRPNYFIRIINYQLVLNQISIYGIIAIGFTFLLICGELDLSIGSNYALTAIVFTLVGNSTNSYTIAIIAALAAATFVGVINGLLVAKVKINSFIVTLGMMAIIKGINQIISNNQNIPNRLPNILSISEIYFLGLSTGFYIFVFIIILSQYILSQTSFGRNIFATGDSYVVAKLAGIKVNIYKFIVFVIVGFFTGIAGILGSMKLSAASVLFGDDLALYVITSVVLGGASLSGGKGSAVRTFFGVVFMGLMFATFNITNISPYIQYIIRGLILLMVVFADHYFLKLRSTKLNLS